ncbi:MAG: peptidoglycan DD-metalloendopeptidase family protein [Roseiflexus sp.]|nr:peptidoglycan DD-metalloendopeptidase family protein [Roseiflexus sp.]MCS7289580.1 peptidoglycan DD-metalloendopeptidase family protein [Roseiflexus sp.]MDW8148631.1 peptidoglycan DD-metalloendopeptidase family protein [Roseiflexaceae bacterium]MDW8231721.1 peptidoglycan DD-metalloendopeptidase family protein [Roseiflexaceae bacterium]
MSAALRSLRRSRGLTLTELAILSGIPARNLGAIELGILSLDGSTRTHLAAVLAVTPNAIPSAPLHVALPSHPIHVQRLTLPFAIALTTTALVTSLLSLRSTPVDPSPAPQSVVVALADRPSEAALLNGTINVAAFKTALLNTIAFPPVQQTLPGVTPIETTSSVSKQPADPLAPPTLTAPATTVGSKCIDRTAPRGYPLIAPIGQIVVTQGYSEGTHAPAAVWGALDFAIDVDGDGYAEPGPTRGVAVIATHDGTARVYPGSWPGGNFVRIENQATGWTTAYGHLDAVLVSDGQEVQRGAQIGTVGSTGYATGPHLHYEVWRHGVNVDPTPFVSSQ